MWNSMQGEITRKGVDQLLLLVNGLEWDLYTSRYTLEALPAVGSQSKVYTWLQHTEDSMKVFAFATVQERAMFLDLLKVSGVGPKLALKCLSGLKYNEFAGALESGDAGKLSKIPGLGLKTAQKIILALKGKLLMADSDVTSLPDAELITSLAEMGFDRRAVEKVVFQAAESPDLAGLAPAEREKLLFQRCLVKLSTQG